VLLLGEGEQLGFYAVDFNYSVCLSDSTKRDFS
jgi:hypothetical protein